jgi:hypothetical protein
MTSSRRSPEANRGTDRERPAATHDVIGAFAGYFDRIGEFVNADFHRRQERVAPRQRTWAGGHRDPGPCGPTAGYLRGPSLSSPYCIRFPAMRRAKVRAPRDPGGATSRAKASSTNLAICRPAPRYTRRRPAATRSRTELRCGWRRSQVQARLPNADCPARGRAIIKRSCRS